MCISGVSRVVWRLVFVVTALATPAWSQDERAPNVIFILIDDMGYGDLSCTGNSDVRTRHLDQLAADGIRFTQFYVNSPICSPSRVAFTTGQYPSRHRIHSFLASRKRNRAREMADFLDPSAPAVARWFRKAGYATAHFGKWHMGGGRDVDDAPLPSAYGFDEHLVNFEGMGDRIDRKATPKHQWTNIYVNRSIDFIRQNKDRPFYLHLWLNDVHDAHVPKQQFMEKYERFSDNPYLQKFYAVLDETDQEIGRLMTTIDELGLSEETIIIATSDNGPTAWPKYYREGFQPPGSTAGFRGRKWSLYEGGIRMPLIVRWKGKIPAGRIDETTVMAAIDYFPTLCALAGTPPPDVPVDGLDRSAAWLGKPQKRDAPIFWEYGRDKSYLSPGLEEDQSPNCAVRLGDWKLLMNAGGDDVELYNLAQSTNEQENVAAKHPEAAARLSAALRDWRENVVPQP